MTHKLTCGLRLYAPQDNDVYVIERIQRSVPGTRITAHTESQRCFGTDHLNDANAHVWTLASLQNAVATGTLQVLTRKEA